MLCAPVPALPEGAGWSFEVKWDGYRAIATKDGAEVHLYSRNGKSFDRRFAVLLPELAALKCKSAVLDGEVVAWNEEGRPDFQALQKRSTADPHLVLFDLIALDGRDLRSRPLSERRKALAAVLPPAGQTRLSFSQELKGEPADVLEKAREFGLEGIVAKRRDSRYEPGERSGAWVKRRAEPAGTFLVGGYEPGAHGFDELILGEKQGDGLHFVARLRNGFVTATRRKVMEAIKPHLQVACPFVDLPETGKSRWGQGLDAEAMKKCRWLKPRVLVHVAFVERTQSGKLRHPRFIGLA